MKNYLKTLFAVIVLFTAVSCQKELQEQCNLPLAGEWAAFSERFNGHRYISFDTGYYTEYTSVDRYQVFDNQIWHADRSDYRQSKSHRYSIVDNDLITDHLEGKVSINGDTLTIGNERYMRLESFNPDYYCAVDIAETGRAVDCGWEESLHEISYELKNPMPWKKVEAVSNVSWITDFSTDDNKISFKVLPSNEDRIGKIIVSYQFAEDVEITVNQSSKRAIKIEGTARYDYTAKDCTIPYSIENPKENSTMSASTDVDWLKELKVNDAALTFSLDENNTGSDRSCEITLEYPEAKILKVKVTQTYSSSAIAVEPASQSTNYAGGKYEFSYSITNPKQGASVKVDRCPEWITDAKVVGNKVSYTVSENNSGSSREGYIVLKYDKVEKSFKVTQSYSSSSIVTNPLSKQTNYVGGDFSFTYTIENPREGAEVTATTQTDWITGIVVSGNKVSYTVTENNSGSSREGNIVLKYGNHTQNYVVNQTVPLIIPTVTSVKLDHRNQYYSIRYRVDNARTMDHLTIDAGASWITNIQVSSTSVSFSVQENDTYNDRNTTLILHYPGARDYEITVSQRVDPSRVLIIKANNISFKMVKVDGGTFTMGATPEQGSDAYSDEKPAHQVTLSDYYIGQTEVTQELWVAVMGSNPSYYIGRKNPVEQVSWNNIVNDFLPKLNALTGKNFILPTEAQWEYAARGGNKSKGYMYSGSNNIYEVAWYKGNSNLQTHPVGQKLPNELGIYDMSGNVWEWCSDRYGNYSADAQTDPTGSVSGSYRVLRGGDDCSNASYCRVSYRYNSNPGGRSSGCGFRLALSL